MYNTTELIAVLETECEIEAHIYDTIVVSSVAEEERYTGPYLVEPSCSEQILKTTGKYMTENVNVHRIPFYEVSNASGGTTVIIDKPIQQGEH